MGGLHRLVARTSSCGHNSPGSTPGEDTWTFFACMCKDMLTTRHELSPMFAPISPCSHQVCKQANTQAAVATTQGKHVRTGKPTHTHTHTQSHSYNSHPKVYTAQDPISTRVCGCLAAPSPFVPSNHHHIYTDFVGRGLITGHESCAFEQHPAQFVQ